MISGLAPGQTGANRNRGEIDLGKRRDGNSRKSHGPSQRDGRRQKSGGHRPSNEWRREAHSINPLGHLKSGFGRATRREALREPVEEDVNDRSRVERQNLTQEQAANQEMPKGDAAPSLFRYQGPVASRPAMQPWWSS